MQTPSKNITPDRLRRIEDTFHAARELAPAERDAFLSEACGTDADLRREVEALLAEAGQPTPGSEFGPYRIEASIGKGGMGEVWKARDPRLNRDVAIKISAQKFSGRFEREARAIAALNHPNICTVYDIGPNYLVMEYIDGAPLKGPLPPDLALKYAEQICDALDAAHGSGIVHRDLKPGNILLSKQGIKLLDFGLAQMQAGPDDPTMTQLTQAGAVMGTPAYMAPEQWEGKQADARSDIYSFGCILYEMLTGKRAAGRLAAPVQPIAGVSPEAAHIISKCLETDPGLRYQHVSEIRADILRLKRDADTASMATAPKPRAAVSRGRAISTVAAALALLIAGYFVFPLLLHGTPKLTDRDTIVLADFVNNTGDPVFDGALRQGLVVQLEQSPFLSLVSEDRIQRMLPLMGRAADARLTPELGKEVCERIGSTAVLEGSIGNLGSQYVVGLRARVCRSGDVLDEEQVQAARKEDVLNALSQAAVKFRARVGESLAMVQKHNTPLPEATTHSLDALKAYSQGLAMLSARGDAAASPFFKHAAEIDPQFAMAQVRLGLAYGDVGESALAAESFGKARQLRDRASDQERFFIDGMYDLEVTGNLERADRTFEGWENTYPRDREVHGLRAAMIYVVLGKFKESLEEARKVVAIDPDFAIGYLQVAFNEAFLNNLDASDATLRQAAARKLETPEFSTMRYNNAFLRGDSAGMAREVALSQGNAETEDWLAADESFTQAYSGHLRQARNESQHAVELAQQASRQERAAGMQTGSAVREALFGNTAEGNRAAKEALRLSGSRDVKYGAALALALSGDAAGSMKLTDELERQFPEDTQVKFNYLPSVRALLVLKTDPARAVRLLSDAGPYELGTPSSSVTGFFGNLYPVYVRGLAYLSARDGASAAVQFQRIIDHRNIVGNDPIGALAHLQMGRAYVVAGDTARAKAAYGDFLNLWSSADSDIPILIKARTESARLQ